VFKACFVSTVTGVVVPGGGAGSVDAKLREWSQGVTGDKTFQELEEEFAEFLIPKVWELEDRKVSRVADKLKVSPKKVRRVLSHLGLLQAVKDSTEETTT